MRTQCDARYQKAENLIYLQTLQQWNENARKREKQQGFPEEWKCRMMVHGRLLFGWVRLK